MVSVESIDKMIKPTPKHFLFEVYIPNFRGNVSFLCVFAVYISLGRLN